MGDRIVVMRDGRIHQVGPPLQVYEHTVNRFVAGFIGIRLALAEDKMHFFDPETEQVIR